MDVRVWEGNSVSEMINVDRVIVVECRVQVGVYYMNVGGGGGGGGGKLHNKNE